MVTLPLCRTESFRRFVTLPPSDFKVHVSIRVSCKKTITGRYSTGRRTNYKTHRLNDSDRVN